jgi:hypothetical protein
MRGFRDMSPPRRRGRPGESDEPYEGRRKKEAVGGIAGMDEKKKTTAQLKLVRIGS